ncbi:MAG: hypothetical protein ACI91R_001726 [Vicingaceae bacterium]|jgi:hypothetical protein
MEEKYYNILWIDDEHEGMSGFKGDAKFNNIQLIPFKSLNDGITELKKNYPIYDGVLLDAKFFENENDVRGSEDTDNVHRAKEELLLLPKKFEVFVLTGQAEAYEDKTFNKAFKNVYKKGIDEDIEQLFIDIKQAADRQIDTQIRHKYQRVFEVCTDKYIGGDASSTLLSLLKSLEDNDNNLDSNDKLNTIRKIVEKLFVALNRIGILPDELTGNINGSSKFLAGADPSYYLNEEIADKTTAYLLRSILTVTQDGSHIGSSSSLGVNNHIVQRATPYLFSSVLFQLLDVLLWFKEFADKHQDIEKNKLLATLNQMGNFSIYEGEIAQDSNNNYYCGEHLLNYRFVSDNYHVGDQIKITGESENTNSRTNTYYSKYATSFTKTPQ